MKYVIALIIISPVYVYLIFRLASWGVVKSIEHYTKKIDLKIQIVNKI